VPSFVQSQVQFGAYVFAAATRVLTRDQPTTIDEEKIPFLDGSSAPSGTRGSKIITLDGMIGGLGAVDSSGTLMTSSNHAEAEINLLSSYLESGYQPLQFLDILPARTLQVQKRKSTFTPVPGSGRTAYDFTIEMLAQDPRWVAAAVTTVGPTAFIANSGPVIGGSAITYPVFTFIGAYVNPTIYITPAGLSGSIRLQVTRSMLAGDTLVLDCDPRNRLTAVKLNGVPRLDLIDFTLTTNAAGDSAFFPYLLPGTTVSLNAGSFTVNGTSVTVTWREAYLF
jgi:hypothetical protein